MPFIKKILIVGLLATGMLAEFNPAVAQTTLTLQPSGATGIDATISNFPGEGTLNYGTNAEFVSESKSINFTPNAKRGLIKFDLSSIPTNATILSANLSLYAYNPGTGGHLVANNNMAYLFKVTQAWNEGTVTWASQPQYSTADTIILPISDSANQDYLNIDLRIPIQGMVATPASNFGFLFKQKYECTCNGRMIFASSDNATASLRPKLVVTYAVCSGAPPAATISPSGTPSVCFGTNQTFTANAGAGYAYQWYRNGVPIPGNNAATYATGVSGAYTVRVINPQGCSATSAASNLTVSLENAKITTAAGSTTTGCANGGLTMNATASGAGNSYFWLLNGNGAGAANNASYTTAIPGNYSCIITNSTSTCNYTTNTIVSQNQVATMTTSGSNYFCDSNAFYMTVQSVNIGTTRTYQWQLNGTNIAGANGFSYGATATGVYRCVIDDAMCAGNTYSPDYQVTSGVPPNYYIYTSFGNITVANVCSGQSVDLWLKDAATNDDYIYGGAQWYRNGIPLPWNGGIPFLGSVDNTGRYDCSVTGDCGTSWTPTFVVHSTVPGTILPEISPSSTVVSCGPVFLSDPFYFNEPWVSYQWQMNGVNIPGATSYFYNATQTGSYRCIFGNGCGTIASAATQVTISAPPATLTPAGPVTLCAGGSVVLNANTGTGLTYQWKKFGNIIAGATSASYTATSAGTYKVVVTNTAGCSTSSAAVTVTVNALPAATISASGSTTFCPGGSVLLNANTGTGLTYQWKKGSNLINGATSSSYTATTSGTYKAIVTNATGCSKTSNGIAITVLAAPTATITAGGPTTFCSGDSVVLTANTGGGLSYQWKKGSTTLVGATTNTYSAKVTGNFKCVVTNANGCTKTSNVIAVSVPCRLAGEQGENTLDGISVFPNPSNGDLTITVADAGVKEIKVLDELGKMVFGTHVNEENNVFELHSLTQGVYFIRTNTSITRRIVVL